MMEVLSPSEEGLKRAIAVLRSGGVVAHATETCYGLACDLKNLEAVRKLFAIKRRPENQPVSALFASVRQAHEYLEWNELAEKLAREHLPGPLTIILKAKPGCALHVCPAGCPVIGVRISPNKTAMRLVQMFGSPLSTTSANIHGASNPYSIEEIVHQYEGVSDLPDVMLDDGLLPEHEASTVIDVSDGSIHVLRQGSLRIGEG